MGILEKFGFGKKENTEEGLRRVEQQIEDHELEKKELVFKKQSQGDPGDSMGYRIRWLEKELAGLREKRAFLREKQAHEEEKAGQ